LASGERNRRHDKKIKAELAQLLSDNPQMGEPSEHFEGTDELARGLAQHRKADEPPPPPPPAQAHHHLPSRTRLAIIMGAAIGGAAGVVLLSVLAGTFFVPHFVPAPAPRPAPKPVASAPPRAVAQTAGSLPAMAILRRRIPGAWHGRYVCQKGQTAIELSLTRVGDDGTIDGNVMLFNLPGQGNAKPGRFSVMGVYDVSADKLQFDPVAWIDRPEGYSMIGFNLTPTADWTQLSGQVYTPGCSQIELSR